MLKTVLIAAFVLTAATPVLAASNPPAAQIEAAERAFAADGLTMGVRGSFLKHMADDAIMFAPAPTSAKALYGAKSGEREPKIEWWPAFIVAARSGDLGLSTGPAVYDGVPGGWFSSIWRKGADGTWRWIYDGGGAANAAQAPSQATPAIHGPVSAKGEGSAAKAFDIVRAAEASLAKATSRDAPAAYRAVLSGDAHLLGPRGTRPLLPTAVDTRLSQRPATMKLTLRGGGASKAGDLVWTHGEADWTETTKEGAQKIAAAHYMHVWQRRPDGWRLIFEALINDR